MRPGRLDRIEIGGIDRGEIIRQARTIFTIGGEQLRHGCPALAQIVLLLGQRIAKQQAITRIARLPQNLPKAGDMVALRAHLAQTGEQVMRARIARNARQQRLDHLFGFVHFPQKPEGCGQIVAIVAHLGRGFDGKGKVGQRGGMIAEPGIDAAHGIAAERVIGQVGFGIGQCLRGGAVLTGEDLEPGELGAIFAARGQCDGLCQFGQRRTDRPLPRLRHGHQEMPLGGSLGPGDKRGGKPGGCPQIAPRKRLTRGDGAGRRRRDRRRKGGQNADPVRRGGGACAWPR
jgi:hypothetical protein